MSHRPTIHSYYFGANDYMLVPAHIEEDMAWMADHGTQSVALGVIEGFIRGFERNIEHIARAAERHDMTLDLVPSFVCGLVAGSPHVPCSYLATRPHLWALTADGVPPTRSHGAMGSIYQPEVFDHFLDVTDRMLQGMPFKRVIWDEPKSLVPFWFPDHNPAALAANPNRDWGVHVAAVVEFFSRVNDALRGRHPEVEIWLFDEAYKDESVVNAAARIRHLDAFGCDGKVWPGAVTSLPEESPRKYNTIPDGGPHFLGAARREGKQSLALLENHALDGAQHPWMEESLPAIAPMGWDHLIYYYYPRNCEDPDGNMAIINRWLRSLQA